LRIAVTGSIATDHLLTFPGRFTDQLIADKLEKISLSFLADSLEIRRGGVAANIAFGLGSLGLRPLLVGTVGPDFADYREWLEAHGVDTSEVRQSTLRHTARFISTADADTNQIGTFYPGAMSEDGQIDLGDLPGTPDLVLIGAGDPDAMSSFTGQCRGLQIPFAADFSQQLAFTDGERVLDLLDGAAYLFSNEYEAHLTEHKTGCSSDEIIARVGIRVTTLGKDGARVDRAGEQPIVVPPVSGAQPRDPTGSGDAFRVGFLAAIAWGLSLERAAQLGNLIAVHALEVVGPQDYELKPGPLAERLEAAYGAEAAADLAGHYG
jgi:adenosine kinase